MNISEHLQSLLSLIGTEQNEERQNVLNAIGKYSPKERVKQGVTWYPISISDSYMDQSDRLIMEIDRVNQLNTPHEFGVGRIVSMFTNKEGTSDEDKTTGTILSIRGNQAKVVMNCDGLEDWMKTGKVGIDLLYDETSFKEMKRTLKILQSPQDEHLKLKIANIYGNKKTTISEVAPVEVPSLNDSQNEALNNCLAQNEIAIIHGPPGTGKTTTLLEVIEQSLGQHPQILVTAPSNNAVDLLVEKLDQKGINVLRIGNPARINEHIQQLSMAWKVTQHPDFSQIKKMKKKSQEFRNMAAKYKRNFGYSEREQRKALFDEAWRLQKDAFQIEDYIVNDLLENAQVIASTLVGSSHQSIRDRKYGLCIIDEASQALEPASWIPILRSKKVIMAGDHKQLPPTVKSKDAAKGGLSKSLFEACMEHTEVDVMLATQYRMNQQIMEYSSNYFYDGKLVAHSSVASHQLPGQDLIVEYIDTAGCSFDEEFENGKGQSSGSLINFHEADLMLKHLYSLFETLQANESGKQSFSYGLISPYKGQVELLKRQLQEFPFNKEKIKVNTIDGFQGQERDVIYISLVRSNDRNDIGFLKDYRRMNVALTRAKKKLVICGDSATIGQDPFYADLISHIEANGGYRSAWELLYD